jgi:hypothetical protein
MLEGEGEARPPAGPALPLFRPLALLRAEPRAGSPSPGASHRGAERRERLIPARAATSARPSMTPQPKSCRSRCRRGPRRSWRAGPGARPGTGPRPGNSRGPRPPLVGVVAGVADGEVPGRVEHPPAVVHHQGPPGRRHPRDDPEQPRERQHGVRQQPRHGRLARGRGQQHGMVDQGRLGSGDANVVGTWSRDPPDACQVWSPPRPGPSCTGPRTWGRDPCSPGGLG